MRGLSLPGVFANPLIIGQFIMSWQGDSGSITTLKDSVTELLACMGPDIPNLVIQFPTSG